MSDEPDKFHILPPGVTRKQDERRREAARRGIRGCLWQAGLITALLWAIYLYGF